MSNAKIQQALGNLFDKQRTVFWCDTRREFRADFNALDLAVWRRSRWTTTSLA